jgi:uncharacterized protein (TIGR02722 family)
MQSSLRQRLLGALLLVGSLLLGSCAGKSVYVAPGTTTQSGTYSDTDMHMMAAAMYASLQKKLETVVPAGATKPIVALTHIDNKTSEHMDSDVLADKLQIEMIKAGSLRFVDRSKIRDISKEFDLGGSGLVNPDMVKKAGNVLGADFLLAGDMTSISKSEGRNQLNFYRLSMRLVQVETDEVVWADDFEIKKASTKGLLDW